MLTFIYILLLIIAANTSPYKPMSYGFYGSSMALTINQIVLDIMGKL